MWILLNNKAQDYYPISILAILVSAAAGLNAQIPLTEQQAIELALQNHPAVEAAQLEISRQEVLKNAGPAWDPTQLFHNIAADPELGMFGTTTVGIQQNFPSGKQTRARRQLHASQQNQARAGLAIARQSVVRQLRELYHHLSYMDGKAAHYRRLDSVYQRVYRIADIRYQAGEIALAEKLAAQDKARQVQLEAQTVQHEIEFDRIVLQQLLGLNEPVLPVVEPLHEGRFSIADTVKLYQSALAQYDRSAIELARSEQAVTRAQFAPTASAGVYGQYLGNQAMYPGWQLGLNVPLFQKSLRAQSEAATIQIANAEATSRHGLLRRQNAMAHLLHEQEKYLILLDYYNTEGRALAAELLRTAELNYSQGELSYADFAQLLEQAAAIELEHLENLLGLSQTVIGLEALTGE